MKRWKINFYWPLDCWYIGSTFRFNGGGYMYGAQPYKEWSLGPMRIRKYI